MILVYIVQQILLNADECDALTSIKSSSPAPLHLPCPQALALAGREARPGLFSSLGCSCPWGTWRQGGGGGRGRCGALTPAAPGSTSRCEALAPSAPLEHLALWEKGCEKIVYYEYIHSLWIDVFPKPTLSRCSFVAMCCLKQNWIWESARIWSSIWQWPILRWNRRVAGGEGAMFTICRSLGEIRPDLNKQYAGGAARRRYVGQDSSSAACWSREDPNSSVRTCISHLQRSNICQLLSSAHTRKYLWRRNRWANDFPMNRLWVEAINILSQNVKMIFGSGVDLFNFQIQELRGAWSASV